MALTGAVVNTVRTSQQLLLYNDWQTEISLILSGMESPGPVCRDSIGSVRKKYSGLSPVFGRCRVRMAQLRYLAMLNAERSCSLEKRSALTATWRKARVVSLPPTFHILNPIRVRTSYVRSFSIL